MEKSCLPLSEPDDTYTGDGTKITFLAILIELVVQNIRYAAIYHLLI